MVELDPVQLSKPPRKQQKNLHVYSMKPKVQLYIPCFLRIDSQAEIGNLDIHYLTRTSQCAKGNTFTYYTTSRNDIISSTHLVFTRMTTVFISRL